MEISVTYYLKSRNAITSHSKNLNSTSKDSVGCVNNVEHNITLMQYYSLDHHLQQCVRPNSK